MQFEILNTIQFLVGLLVVSVIYHQAKKNIKSFTLKWKYFFVVLVLLLLTTHQQFYTLTEVQDVKATQNVMLKQSSSISNDKEVASYLSDKKEVSEVNLDEEVLKQQLKSEELARKIEKQYKENK